MYFFFPSLPLYSTYFSFSVSYLQDDRLESGKRVIRVSSCLQRRNRKLSEDESGWSDKEASDRIPRSSSTGERRPLLVSTDTKHSSYVYSGHGSHGDIEDSTDTSKSPSDIRLLSTVVN